MVDLCLICVIEEEKATSWWLNQPLWKNMSVKMGSSSSNFRGEHKKILEKTTTYPNKLNVDVGRKNSWRYRQDSAPIGSNSVETLVGTVGIKASRFESYFGAPKKNLESAPFWGCFSPQTIIRSNATNTRELSPLFLVAVAASCGSHGWPSRSKNPWLLGKLNAQHRPGFLGAF